MRGIEDTTEIGDGGTTFIKGDGGTEFIEGLGGIDSGTAFIEQDIGG